MLELNLSNAPEKLWKYDQESYHKLTEEDVKYSEMTENERKLVHGLLKFMKPKRVLEIGVAEGGGSIVILNALQDNTGATLTSIDLMKKCWNDSTKDVGFACTESKLDKRNWNLFVGQDPSQIIEELSKEGKFDFVIIDTAHKHPVESLNFLTVFPFLTENCTVVLHDIGYYAAKIYRHSSLSPTDSKLHTLPWATKLLFDTMVGEKRTLPLSEYPEETTLSNIGVCQLEQISEKYIGSIFSMLQFPWGLYPENSTDFMSLFQKHYSEELYNTFCQSLNFNYHFLLGDGKYINKLNTNPAFYGKKKLYFMVMVLFSKKCFLRAPSLQILFLRFGIKIFQPLPRFQRMG